MKPPRLIAITPGDSSVDLFAALTHLGDCDWPTVIIREPQRTAAENDALVVHALDIGIKTIIVHAKSPTSTPPQYAHYSQHHIPTAQPAGFGVSVHDAVALENALIAGATYALLSPLYRPTSKPTDRRPTLGVTDFIAMTQDKPVLALGGVTAKNYPTLLAAGVFGVAVMGAVFDAPNRAHQFMTTYRAQKMNNSSS